MSAAIAALSSSLTFTLLPTRTATADRQADAHHLTSEETSGTEVDKRGCAWLALCSPCLFSLCLERRSLAHSHAHHHHNHHPSLYACSSAHVLLLISPRAPVCHGERRPGAKTLKQSHTHADRKLSAHALKEIHTHTYSSSAIPSPCTASLQPLNMPDHQESRRRHDHQCEREQRLQPLTQDDEAAADGRILPLFPLPTTTKQGITTMMTCVTQSSFSSSSSCHPALHSHHHRRTRHLLPYTKSSSSSPASGSSTSSAVAAAASSSRNRSRSSSNIIGSMRYSLSSSRLQVLLFLVMLWPSMMMTASASYCPHPAVPLYAQVSVSGLPPAPSATSSLASASGIGISASQQQQQQQHNIRHGSLATYACDEGYELFGTPVRTCAPDGKWTGDIPYCGTSSSSSSSSSSTACACIILCLPFTHTHRHTHTLTHIHSAYILTHACMRQQEARALCAKPVPVQQESDWKARQEQ